ncbi:hypothetical protein KDN32_14115 [Nocardioides sp. J2M5]|jgi:hypothetical protein|uniref:hypothetical protein n=1 Tax=Nocardioides palaemonis TaxID=2829810 RepID=UPI001BAAFCD3|nr:hypothetical protein [Nocardioides palaemonis]MBS2938874.1 hypothetical protein [Nocardioides palaemonis]
MTEAPDADSGATGDRPGNHHLVGAAAAACAVCCAAPIVGFLGVAGFAATAVTLVFAGVVFAFVVGLLTVAAVLTRRARVRRMSCAPTDPTASVPELVELGPTRTTDDA